METRSNNYEFLKPHEDDFYDIEVQNGNWDKVDEALKEIDNIKVNTSGGNISETVIKTLEEQEDFPEIPASGPVKTIFGKIRKNLEDWKAFKDGIVTIGRLSNHYENDASKIPTASLVYALKQTTDQLDSGKAAKDHSHDDRYYTEAEINRKLSAINTATLGAYSSIKVVYAETASETLAPAVCRVFPLPAPESSVITGYSIIGAIRVYNLGWPGVVQAGYCGNAPGEDVWMQNNTKDTATFNIGAVYLYGKK